MGEILELPTIAKDAIEKIDNELEHFTGSSQYDTAVSQEVASTIKYFCEQSNIFAHAVLKTTRTLSDVVYESMKEWADAHAKKVSDIDVYRAVVHNYFPNSEVQFKMVLELGEEPTLEELNRETVRKTKKEKQKAEPKPVEPPRELTEIEKIELKARQEQEKAERKRLAEEAKLKEALNKEKKKNEEMGQMFLFDLI